MEWDLKTGEIRGVSLFFLKTGGIRGVSLFFRRMLLLELTLEHPNFIKAAIFSPNSISRPSKTSKLRRWEIVITI
jgi:hypothetical protein